MRSTRRMMYGVVMALAVLAIAGIAVACEVRTPGYWKNHPEAWPVDGFWISDMYHAVYYSKDNAIEIMQTPVKGDKTYNVFNAYVAARLNCLSGAGFPLESTQVAFLMADLFLNWYPPGNGVTASSPEWKWMEPYFSELDAYNNGLRGVPAGD